MKTESLDFRFNGKRMSGTLDLPADRPPSAIVVFVLGHGKTDVVAGKWYYDLRSRFVEAGLGCYLWDKAGCGKSEGEYDHSQTVQSSAQETLAAIAELRRRGTPGSDRVGFWGISRAGWIVPLVIQQLPSPPSGSRSAERTTRRASATCSRPTSASKGGASPSSGHCSGSGGAVTRSSARAVRSKRISGRPGICDRIPSSSPSSRGGHRGGLSAQQQKALIAQHPLFDEASGLMIYVPGFRQILKGVRCPVLALFGEKDSVVDWRSTMALYRETIGSRVDADLAIRTFPGLQPQHAAGPDRWTPRRPETTGPRRPCDGYQEAITTWIKEKDLSRPRNPHPLPH
jgi:alpha/beta superfamily hydrolase